jgi:Cytochrome c554 and c-prime
MDARGEPQAFELRQTAPPMPSRAHRPSLLAALVITASAALGASVEAQEPGGQAAARPSLSGGLSAPPPPPGPSPRARPAGFDSHKANEACASCHQEIAEEWRGSMHREAWIDPVFQQAYAIETQAFCRGCHAPEADAAMGPDEGAKAVGVGCTTCHVQGDHVVGARSVAMGASIAGSSVASPHAVFGDARLATREACGSCHQFDFPGENVTMQDTMREHARSSFASVECQSCHMPMVAPKSGGRSHRSHSFAVFKNPAMIRKAATVSARRSGAREVEVTIAAAGAGHAFPTGDMFRRIEVRAEAVDASGKVIARAEPVHLGRTFIDQPRTSNPHEFYRAEASDTRVLPPGAGGPSLAALRFGQPIEGATIRWSVLYQRMGTAMAASFGVDQAIDEVVVGEGAIPPASIVQ